MPRAGGASSTPPPLGSIMTFSAYWIAGFSLPVVISGVVLTLLGPRVLRRWAFPLLFLGSHATSYAEVARIAGWAFAIWGSALYWCAALLYVEQARRLVRGHDLVDQGGRPPGTTPPGTMLGGDREAGPR